MFLITFLSIQWSSLSDTGKVIISLCSIAEKMCGGKVSPHGIYCCNMEFSLALNLRISREETGAKILSNNDTYVRFMVDGIISV